MTLPEIRVGDLIDLTIERMAAGGFGFAHAASRTIFVSLAAPGERVRVRVDRIQTTVGFATVVDVLEPSASRVEPPCSLYGRCGGCDLQHLDYGGQLDAKRAIVADALRRLAGLSAAPTVHMVASPRPWEYRSVAEWRYDAASGALGYHARESRKVIDVAACPILEPALNAALAAARESIRSTRHPSSREVRAAAGDDGSDSFSTPRRPSRVLSRDIAGETYQFDASCFFQANPSILSALVAEVVRPIESAADQSSGIAVDLYCGVGLFTVPLARRFGLVVGVESDPNAARYARKNLCQAGLATARIDNQAVEKWLARRGGGEIAVLVLDPPRVGAKAAMPGIVRLAPRRIVYVSCDPATLARDLRQLLAGGYDLERVTALDMFPQTHHVEVVAHLVKIT